MPSHTWSQFKFLNLQNCWEGSEFANLNEAEGNYQAVHNCIDTGNPPVRAELVEA
jgi:hypothetical protein